MTKLTLSRTLVAAAVCTAVVAAAAPLRAAPVALKAPTTSAASPTLNAISCVAGNTSGAVCFATSRSAIYTFAHAAGPSGGAIHLQQAPVTGGTPVIHDLAVIASDVPTPGAVSALVGGDGFLNQLLFYTDEGAFEPPVTNPWPYAGNEGFVRGSSRRFANKDNWGATLVGFSYTSNKYISISSNGGHDITANAWATVDGQNSATTCITGAAVPDDTNWFAVVGPCSGQTGATQVLATADGASTWAVVLDTATPPASLTGATLMAVHAISCANATACFATASATTAAGPVAVVLVTADGGRSWTLALQEAAAGGLTPDFAIAEVATSRDGSTVAVFVCGAARAHNGQPAAALCRVSHDLGAQWHVVDVAGGAVAIVDAAAVIRADGGVSAFFVAVGNAGETSIVTLQQ